MVIQSNMNPILTLDVKINGVEAINPKRCRRFNHDRSRMDHRSATPRPSIADPIVEMNGSLSRFGGEIGRDVVDA